jgi:hypothetical protein
MSDDSSMALKSLESLTSGTTSHDTELHDDGDKTHTVVDETVV